MQVLWLDLETTGLDPREDAILEIAAASADLNDVTNVEKFLEVVISYNSIFIPYLDPWVVEAHTKSGLFSACESSSISIEAAEQMLLEIVHEVEDRNDATILAGRSVHFDLAFIRAKMPTLASRLSHRVLDVSAIELDCRSLGMPKLSKNNVHRAKADIIESVEHLKQCRQWRGKNSR